MPTNSNPRLQSICRAHFRLADVYSLNAFIRLQTLVGGVCSTQHAKFARAQAIYALSQNWLSLGLYVR